MILRPGPTGRSAAVPGAQPRGEAEDELGAFVLGEPFGGDQGRGVVGGGDEAGRAGRAELVDGETAGGGEGPLAVVEDLVPVLAQEDGDRDAMPAVDRQGVADLRP